MSWGGVYKIIGADQRQYGPVSAEALRQWVTEGRANGQTLAQAEGSAEWRPMASLPEFAGWFGAPSAAPPPAGAAAAPVASGPGGGWPTTPPDIPTYLPHAILVTLCCCLPLGIPAIVYAAQVSSKLNAGDFAGAAASSAKAKRWFWIALVAGAVSNLAYLGLMLATSARIAGIAKLSAMPPSTSHPPAWRKSWRAVLENASHFERPSTMRLRARSMSASLPNFDHTQPTTTAVTGPAGRPATDRPAGSPPPTGRRRGSRRGEDRSQLCRSGSCRTKPDCRRYSELNRQRS